MKTDKFCTQCGHKSRITANVCSNCGQRFKQVFLKTSVEPCPQCKSARRADAKFCRICGYHFAESIPNEPPIQQPHTPGVELPPAAKIPPMPVEQAEPLPKRSTGKTGILLTPNELKRLRRAQTEHIIFVPRSRKKNNP